MSAHGIQPWPWVQSLPIFGTALPRQTLAESDGSIPSDSMCFWAAVTAERCGRNSPLEPLDPGISKLHRLMIPTMSELNRLTS